MMSFSSLLGLKKGIFFAGTSTRSPVFGLRPTRELRCRVRKLPKPRISILSPARSECTMLSKIVSTITSLSRRVTSVIRATSSIRSAFVISCTFHLRCGHPSSPKQCNRKGEHQGHEVKQKRSRRIENFFVTSFVSPLRPSSSLLILLPPEIEEARIVALQHPRLGGQKLAGIAEQDIQKTLLLLFRMDQR